MDQPKLRSISEGDIPQVVNIQQRVTRREVSDNWRENVKRHVDGPDNAGYVAEVGGKVVGFIIGEVRVGEFGADLSGWLEMMGVDPENMGAGIGQSLARRLFEHFQARGVKEVFTAVPWDSGDLLAFFKNLGFDRSPFINLRLKV